VVKNEMKLTAVFDLTRTKMERTFEKRRHLVWLG